MLKKVSKNPKLLILTEIKRSQGLSVSELCDRIGLSYMGVKQHCIALEKEGYLDTWRRSKGMGRPEKAYRLTDAAQEFFPTEYGNLTTRILNSLVEVYGPSAPDKILYNIYEHDAEELSRHIDGANLEERSRRLAELRDEKGYMSEYYFDRENGHHQIVEYNSPILLCMDHYPILRDLERQLFEKVLTVPVRREEERVSGLYKCIFQLG
ncbi:MAG: winged helix-turn-helix transcriptional regulator [Bdellovibrionaceae bacterium]|nr:winged helix-turn-helix transcriptional regulator [Pseudobdellovibrionaceae bacterium]